jgi:thiaminase/transcriptional activator TenA
MTESFTETSWREIAPLFEAILQLPFNRELAAGTLERERFLYYMIQDAHYLGAFARALAAIAAKAPDAEGQIHFALAAHEAIVVERALHEGFFAEFGVSPERFAATPPAPTCAAYGDFLVATAHLQTYAVGAAAVLPCFQIYYEVGKHLYDIAAPHNPYQKWIDTYRDEAFGDAVRAVLRHTDRAFDAAGEAECRAMRAAYLKSARYEWMFWDAAWRLEAWPV